MRDRTPQLSSFKRTVAMLDAVLDDGGESNVSAIARKMAVPVATAHRQIATLVAEGLLAPTQYGRYVPGARLLSLANKIDEKAVIAGLAKPFLERLASETRSIVQLGTYENDMVTYRLKTGDMADRLFTKIGMQLEAYCSAIGKVLLAHLPDPARQSYLESGPFVALTPRTIVDPQRLAAELNIVRFQGFAEDVGEISEGIRCLAVPVRNHRGQVVAAISVTQEADTQRKNLPDKFLSVLRNAADEIEEHYLKYFTGYETCARVGGVSRTAQTDPGKIAQAVLGGGTWKAPHPLNFTVTTSRVNGARRIEIVGAEAARIPELKAMGCFTEIIAYKTRVFVPLDRAGAIIGMLTA